MARGLLVSFAGFPVAVSSLFPDNGLASLAGTLLAHGHEVQVLDFNRVAVARRLTRPDVSVRLQALLPALKTSPSAELLQALWQISAELDQVLQLTVSELAEELAEQVAQQRSQFVGFKLWSGNGLLAVARLAARLRQQFPQLKLYGGGPAVLYAEELIYELCPQLDVLVDGEGELAILGLARHAEAEASLEQIPNLILRDGQGVRRSRRQLVADLDALPPPAYQPEVYPSLAGDQQIKLLILDDSRGCPMRCAFCVHSCASGSSWREKSGERLLAELDSFAALYGTRAFRLGGSFASPRLLAQLAHTLAGGPRSLFCGFSHPASLSRELIEALARAGCQSLFFGVESFDPADAAVLGKRLSPRRSAQAIRWCLESGIFPVVSIMMPLPGQTAAGRELTRDTLLGLCAGTESSVVTQIPGLMPRSQWWQDPAHYGFALQVPEREYLRLVSTYPIRHIIPVPFWPPLPYTVDGRGFADYASVNGKFQRELGQQGVLVNAADDTALIARVLGVAVRDLQRRLQATLFAGDSEELAALVAAVNAGLEAGGC